jgi:hypothetical protein
MRSIAWTLLTLSVGNPADRAMQANNTRITSDVEARRILFPPS